MPNWLYPQVKGKRKFTYCHRWSYRKVRHYPINWEETIINKRETLSQWIIAIVVAKRVIICKIRCINLQPRFLSIGDNRCVGSQIIVRRSWPNVILWNKNSWSKRLNKCEIIQQQTICLVRRWFCSVLAKKPKNELCLRVPKSWCYATKESQLWGGQIVHNDTLWYRKYIVSHAQIMLPIENIMLQKEE